MKLLSNSGMRNYLKSIKEYAKDYALENTGLKVLALFITSVLWLSVASRPTSRVAIRDVPIEFRNLSNSPPLTVSKADTLSAQVYVEGPRDAIDSLRTGEVVVVADMTNVQPGVRVIRLSLDAGRLPAGVIAREIEPRAIGVTVERNIEKEVPVVPRFDGQPPPGFELIRWQISPPTIRVSGAESQIRDVAELSTETVSLADKTEPFTQPVAIYIGASNLSIIDEGRGDLTLNVTIGEVRRERVFGRVPIALFGAPPGSEPFPRVASVTILGPGSMIESMTATEISVGAQYDAKLPRGGRIPLTATVAPGYADLVVVRSIEPASVQIR